MPVIFLVAIVLAAVSIKIQRTGPEVVIYGNVCGASGGEPCFEPQLKAGFPFPFILDNPGSSVRGKLHILEDEFMLDPFLIDVILIMSLLSLGCLVIGQHITNQEKQNR